MAHRCGLRLVFGIVLACSAFPAPAQERASTGAPPPAAASGWGGWDLQSLAGAASSAAQALGGLTGTAAAPAPGAAPAAGPTSGSAVAGAGAWGGMAQMLGGIDWSKAAGALGALGGMGATGPGAVPPGMASTGTTIPGTGGGGLQDLLALGTGGAGAYAKQILDALMMATPEQRTAFLTGVTTQVPKLANDAMTWWQGLPDPTRQQYMQQITGLLAYVAQMTGFAATAPAAK